MVGSGLRVALVHDYLTQFGGAEQVLGVLQRSFPTRHLHDALRPRGRSPGHRSGHGRGESARDNSLVSAAPPGSDAALSDRNAGHPAATDGFDVVIADSSAWAHQIKPKPDQAFVVYCHSPARFLYGDSDYLAATGVEGLMAHAFIPCFAPFRWLDRRALSPG